MTATSSASAVVSTSGLCSRASDTQTIAVTVQAGSSMNPLILGAPLLTATSHSLRKHVVEVFQIMHTKTHCTKITKRQMPVF